MKRVKFIRYTLKCKLPSCGRIFKSDRYKKYCSPKCAVTANRIMAKMRYREMRNEILKARGELK